ncbi:hypothetical protein WISP_129007 [Willisornis vidua]|uniref:Uncharacterized protein n=1 Tax=Willisornis vidua TaxID=1566151 RepID=A0ABQ9CQJ1_9PASS|nr:hypothetical protein WISP_129007 [Willisornis vidua]
MKNWKRSIRVTDGFSLSAINLTQMKMHGMEQTPKSFPGGSCYLAFCPHLQPIQPHQSGPVFPVKIPILLVNSKTLGGGLKPLDQLGCKTVDDAHNQCQKYPVLDLTVPVLHVTSCSRGKKEMPEGEIKEVYRMMVSDMGGKGSTIHCFAQYKNKSASNEAGRSHAQNKLKEAIQAQLIVDLWNSMMKEGRDAKFHLDSEKKLDKLKDDKSMQGYWMSRGHIQHRRSQN